MRPCEPFLDRKPHASLPIADRRSLHPSIAATPRCSRPRPKRHALNRSPSVRGGSAGLHFEAMRVLRNSGKKANNPEGFRDAVTGFVLADG